MKMAAQTILETNPFWHFQYANVLPVTRWQYWKLYLCRKHNVCSIPNKFSQCTLGISDKWEKHSQPQVICNSHYWQFSFAKLRQPTGQTFSLPSKRNFPISFKSKVAIAKFVWKMQKKSGIMKSGLDAMPLFLLDDLLNAVVNAWM